MVHTKPPKKSHLLAVCGCTICGEEFRDTSKVREHKCIEEPLNVEVARALGWAHIQLFTINNEPAGWLGVPPEENTHPEASCVSILHSIPDYVGSDMQFMRGVIEEAVTSDICQITQIGIEWVIDRNYTVSVKTHDSSVRLKNQECAILALCRAISIIGKGGILG